MGERRGDGVKLKDSKIKGRMRKIKRSTEMKYWRKRVIDRDILRDKER